MNLADYCLVIDNTIKQDDCDFIIKKFEKCPSHHERFDNNAKPNFTQINVTKHKDCSELLDVNEFMIQKAKQYVNVYRQHVTDTKYWPEQYAFEEFRIKRYDNDGIDWFDTHIDAADARSCKRFLVFFWYLNDVEQGGETEFLNFDLKVPPKAGRLLMFPPLWLFPHRGNKPISNTKYIIGSYLHFV